MRYKEGDRVRVRQWEAMLRGNKLVCDNISFLGKPFLFLKTNRRFCGQVVTIKGVANDHYRIEEDNRQCCWIDEMFEGYAFEYGEVIEVSQSGIEITRSDKEWKRRIYIAYTDGSSRPYVCVHSLDENRFREGKSFGCVFYKYARPISKKHTIIIDGVEIKVSDEDYKALKEKLCKGEIN